MSCFRAGIEGADPLLAQLETSTVTAEITGFDGGGDNALGATSRPIIYRPSSPGVWDGFHPIAPTRINGLAPADSVFVTVFFSPPSIPTLPTSSVKVPLNLSVRMPLGQGLVVLPGGPVVVYANTTGGHTWTANLIWEEY
jgi:hypothetical protein